MSVSYAPVFLMPHLYFILFQQEAKRRLHHKGADIAGKLTLRTASPAVLANKGARHRGQANPVDTKPSGLGQRGRKTSRESYKCLTTSPSGLSQGGHKTSQAS